MKQQINNVEIRLDSDPLGRKFKIISYTGIINPCSFPCHGCHYAIWNVDHFCCKKLNYSRNEWGDIEGGNAYPLKTLYTIAENTLSRDVEYLTESISFYECKAKNL